MIPAIFNEKVTVKRRTSTGRDSLNNPIYGAPTSGAGWSTLYTNMPVRFAFNSKLSDFAMTGIRPSPAGVVYHGPQYILATEDRILTAGGIEYTVVSIVPGYVNNNKIDHYEVLIALP